MTSDASARVAESYPPLPGVPVVAPVRIHWTLSCLIAPLAVFVPTRIGPHLAASGWRSALLVHLMSIVWFFGVIFAVVFPLQGGMNEMVRVFEQWTWEDHLLAPLAGATTVLFSLTESWDNFIPVFVISCCIEGFTLLSAFLLTPFIAVGETRRALFGRALRLTWWSTIAILPMAYILPLMVWMYEAIYYGDDAPFVIFIAIGIWAIWWWHMLMRLGHRPPLPAIGPGWHARALCCDTCGYDLTLAPLDGTCTECNTPVVASLPERRVDPSFVSARFPATCVPPLTTGWHALRPRKFGSQLPVWRNRAAARRFLLFVQFALFFIGFAFMQWLNLDEDLFPHAGENWAEYRRGLTAEEAAAGLVAASLPWYADLLAWPFWVLALSRTTIATFAGVLTACIGTVLLNLASGLFSLFGFKASYRHGVVACYASVWLIFPAIFAFAASHYAIWLDAHSHALGGVYTTFFGFLDWSMIITFAAFAPAAILLLLGLAFLRVLLHTTRHANA